MTISWYWLLLLFFICFSGGFVLGAQLTIRNVERHLLKIGLDDLLKRLKSSMKRD